MRIVLDETPPEEPARPGRAWARLAGREMVQIQAPIIGEQELIAALQSGGPVGELPEMAEERDPREQRVIDLLEAEPGLSDTAMARIVYGHGTTHYIEKVRAIKAQQQHKNDNNNGGGRV